MYGTHAEVNFVKDLILESGLGHELKLEFIVFGGFRLREIWT